MSSRSGARQRFPGKAKSQEKDIKDGKKLTEEEAVAKASRRWIVHFFLAFSLSLLTPVIILMFIPSPLKAKEYFPLTAPRAFEGPLAPNNHLASADAINRDELKGPESMVIVGEYIYTGTADGWVNRLHKGEVKRLVQFGKGPSCGDFDDEVTCGRPLGLRMDKNGFLVVCDAYLGVFRVNVTTGDYETIYKAATHVNGKASKFLNDLDIDDNGRIYFTDSSTVWHRNQFLNIILEGDSTGRLLMFDPKTKKTKQLVSDLIFPNGVQLTPDQSDVLVAEYGKAGIQKYNIKSKSLSLWVDGFPGFPDNIRYDEPSQTYWVGIGFPRNEKFSILDFLITKPWLREMAAKVVSTSHIETLKYLLSYIVNPELKALAIQLDMNGSIVGSLQGRKGCVIDSVSELQVSNGAYYVGSFHQSFLARLDMKKLSKSKL